MNRVVVVFLALLMLCTSLTGCLGEEYTSDMDILDDDIEMIIEDPRGEAYNFSLEVINTYFSGDFQAYLNLLAPMIYSTGDNESFPREDLEPHHCFCDDGWGCNNYTEYNMTQYLQVYEPVVKSYDEYIPEFNLSGTYLEEYFDEYDFFFLGGDVRDDQSAFFTNDDVLSFFVSYETGQWQVISVG